MRSSVQSYVSTLPDRYGQGAAGFFAVETTSPREGSLETRFDQQLWLELRNELMHSGNANQ